tara:strand:+ start:452 stop:985 length:534 start_codon:yes stop_codon:yes gene_type:complete
MGYLSYGYKASKTPIGKKVVETVKNIFTSKNKVSPDIKSVAPNVPTTKKQKLVSKLKKTTQRVKGATARLKQTQFERANPKFKGEDFTFATRVGRSSKVRDNKMAGGFMGKRMGYKKGTGLRKKSNVEKIKKTFGTKKGLGMQSVIYGLDKNPKITAADPKAKFIAAANKKKKKKII